MRFENKVALVTGGGVDIGRATAVGFAREGADVAVAARRFELLEETAREVERAGRQGLAVRCDVTQEDQVTAMVDQVLERFGRIDILVNNAGIGNAELGGGHKVEDMPLDEFAAHFWTNNVGTFLCCREVLRRSMIPRRAGAIVVTSSGAGRRGGPLSGGYSTSRFGLIGFTQALASEVGDRGIRVNCVCPGAIMTGSLRKYLEYQVQTTGRDFDTLVRAFESAAALGRLATPEEVANTTLFLCSDQASGLTGQSVNANAGAQMN